MPAIFVTVDSQPDFSPPPRAVTSAAAQNSLQLVDHLLSYNSY